MLKTRFKKQTVFSLIVLICGVLMLQAAAPTCATFTEDFESGASSWTASGIWEIADDTTCSNPGTGEHVAHFGSHGYLYGLNWPQFYYCDMQIYDSNWQPVYTEHAGNLDSPTISDITEDTELTFESWLDSDYDPYSDPKHRAQVQVISGGTTTTIWFHDSWTSATTASWTSESVSLAAWAGETIQLRFRFETLNAWNNHRMGWFIDDVVVSDCP